LATSSYCHSRATSGSTAAALGTSGDGSASSLRKASTASSRLPSPLATARWNFSVFSYQSAFL
jgi:hypothetical protein